MKIVLVGGPGAGKGTQAEVLKKKYGLEIVGTGEIFRSEMKRKTELGLEIQKYMDEGTLVPDDITIKAVIDRLSDKKYEKGFILDGFPRTIKQAQVLDEKIKVDIVIAIKVKEDEIVKRLSGRRICPECNFTYHVFYNPPKVDGICDIEGAKLIQREDDQPETIKHRIKQYKKDTKPLIDYYGDQGILKVVIGQEKIEDTTKLTLEAVEGYK